MPTVSITFNLPEEKRDLDTALRAEELSCAVEKIGAEVFRPARKHGYKDPDVQHLLDSLDLLVKDSEASLPESWPSDEFGSRLAATDLVRMLEKMFYDILNNED